MAPPLWRLAPTPVPSQGTELSEPLVGKQRCQGRKSTLPMILVPSELFLTPPDSREPLAGIRRLRGREEEAFEEGVLWQNEQSIS